MTIEGEKPEIERRAWRRQRVLKGGTLRFNKGYGALECRVRDLSEGGARLLFGDTAAVPSTFQFRVSDEKSFRDATVRWRSMTDMGIAFA